MPNFAHITIVGHAGNDPEEKFTQSGKAFVTFNVAVTTGWGDRKTTTWYRVTVWREKLGDLVHERVRKGHAVLVSGGFSIRTWEKKDGGGMGWTAEVDADEVVFLRDGRREPPEDDGHAPRFSEVQGLPF